ncbi:hypothetical protein BAY59_10710 [Prauserella coralliicola]|nr:hypothetical protein BAY59_10710 [Prauserella coralliicola]
MTNPGESPTDVALRFIRDDIAALRANVQGELSAIRTEFAEVRAHGAKIALLEHRVVQLESEQQKTGDRRWALYLTLITAFVAIGLSVLNLLGG